ncbi:MAG: YbjN domain-containing protein [Spirochaetales bacterium]|nr:YbjN domain-containing protein [Spirochaetales bacterium]
MTLKDKLESYFIDLNVQYDRKEENLWVISDDERSLQNVLVSIDDQVVTITVNVMDLPGNNREQFYKKLLTLNATDMIHGAYAIEGNNVVLVDTLEGETMDLKELQASLDAIGLALTQHYQVLSEYRN